MTIAVVTSCINLQEFQKVRTSDVTSLWKIIKWRSDEVSRHVNQFSGLIAAKVWQTLKKLAGVLTVKSACVEKVQHTLNHNQTQTLFCITASLPQTLTLHFPLQAQICRNTFWYFGIVRTPTNTHSHASYIETHLQFHVRSMLRLHTSVLLWISGPLSNIAAHKSTYGSIFGSLSKAVFVRTLLFITRLCVGRGKIKHCVESRDKCVCVCVCSGWVDSCDMSRT